ncbi:MAG: HAD family hydrolase [Acutalibacteraceae bacterium]
MINNVFNNFIFDFGQVIVRFDTEYLTSVYIKDSDDLKLAEEVVFDRFYWDKLDAGTITDDEVKKGICSRLPQRLHSKACLVYDNWYKNLKFIPGMPELIRNIKENGGKLYLLSNISLTFAENYKTVPMLKELLDMFDGLIFSASVGMTKPDINIFRYILDKYSLKAEESIFIDDNKNNISGAKKVGIKGFLFDENVSGLYNLLKK